MKKILIDTLELTSGAIYITISNNRFKLSDCSVKVELYEHHYPVSVIGGKGIKKYKVSLILCDDIDDSDCDLQKVSGYDIIAEIRRKDGVYERLVFGSVVPVELEEHGTWSFEVTDYEMIKKLFTFASC